MDFLYDVLRLSYPTDLNNSTWGCIVIDSVRYERMSDFELAQRDIKPTYIIFQCETKNFPITVMNKFVNKRHTLVVKIKSMALHIVQEFEFEGTPQPKKPEPKIDTVEDVKERIEKFMV